MPTFLLKNKIIVALKNPVKALVDTNEYDVLSGKKFSDEELDKILSARPRQEKIAIKDIKNAAAKISKK